MFFCFLHEVLFLREVKINIRNTFLSAWYDYSITSELFGYYCKRHSVFSVCMPLHMLFLELLLIGMISLFEILLCLRNLNWLSNVYSCLSKATRMCISKWVLLFSLIIIIVRKVTTFIS